MISEILSNKLLVTVILTLVISQIIKSIINLITNEKVTVKSALFGLGGMPSTHSAVVSCLTFSLFLMERFSFLMVASLVFSIIIIRDALGVRQTVGEHAKIINHLEMKVYNTKKPKYKFSESIGHTPPQVVAGISLGITMAILVVYLWPL